MITILVKSQNYLIAVKPERYVINANSLPTPKAKPVISQSWLFGNGSQILYGSGNPVIL